MWHTSGYEPPKFLPMSRVKWLWLIIAAMIVAGVFGTLVAFS
jgi:hypothetical protein